jgi:hypothetical protein
LANYLFRLSKENENPEQGSAESWYRFQAYHTAKQFSERFPEGLGSKACKMLMREISQSDFSAELDQQWYPNTSGLLKLKYKNMRKLYVYVFDLKNPNDTAANPAPGKLISLQQFPLKDFGDFYEHRVQLDLPCLPIGKYYVELADTVLTYNDAARLATYIIVAPARLSYFTNSSGKQEAFAIDCKTGFSRRLKNVKIDSLLHFPYTIPAKQAIVLGAKAEVLVPNSSELREIKHQLPKPSLSLNKAAYLPGDIVECVAKITPQEYKRFVHLGAYIPLLLNQGQAINVRDFLLMNQGNDSKQVLTQGVASATPKQFWFNQDNQFVIRFHLDSVLRDGDYILQVGDASITIPVRKAYNEGSFSIEAPLKATFGERMHFTAKWNNGVNQSFIPKQVNVSVALLAYNDKLLSPSRHIIDQSVKVNKDGSFSFDFIPTAAEKSEEQMDNTQLSRYTFTWNFLDSSAQTQTQFNRYYISSPDAVLVSEIPEKVEYNGLLESLPILKAIDAEGALVGSYPCTAQLIRLRQPLITPINTTFTPDYYSIPIDSFRAKFPYFAYGGESNIQNFTKRDTVLNVLAISTEALSRCLFPKLDNGAYLFQVQSTDPHLHTKPIQNRFFYVNPLDEKHECPEWLSISFLYDSPLVHCGKKGQEIQCYFFSDKGIIKHTNFKSNGKWKKLKCPAGTRSIVVETYLDGKHIVRSWAYPEIEELL